MRSIKVRNQHNRKGKKRMDTEVERKEGKEFLEKRNEIKQKDDGRWTDRMKIGQ
jgi:hypothetical protein